jgi:hypothetical protein
LDLQIHAQRRTEHQRHQADDRAELRHRKSTVADPRRLSDEPNHECDDAHEDEHATASAKRQITGPPSRDIKRDGHDQ